mmetsp:Transcript_6552/g.18277  ORF Transcript_6552/g.18277 Transcript_6552/m.18277 type:complete len:209 (-) Transcript_6552:26-652(-)
MHRNALRRPHLPDRAGRFLRRRPPRPCVLAVRSAGHAISVGLHPCQERGPPPEPSRHRVLPHHAGRGGGQRRQSGLRPRHPRPGPGDAERVHPAAVPQPRAQDGRLPVRVAVHGRFPPGRRLPHAIAGDHRHHVQPGPHRVQQHWVGGGPAPGIAEAQGRPGSFLHDDSGHHGHPRCGDDGAGQYADAGQSYGTVHSLEASLVLRSYI